MDFVTLEKSDGIAVLSIRRGNVNALNGLVVHQLREHLKALEMDRETRAIILTGSGKFFSFGFDVPEFLTFTKEQFTEFVINFTDLYKSIFLYSKPIVAALNGHTIAGGCMLALACDYRVMVGEKAKISLNEISFSSSLFAGSTEILRFWVGSANATAILYSGAMYPADEAQRLGLVHYIAKLEDYMSEARKTALVLASKDPSAFASIKSLLRKYVADEILNRERESIKEFVDIWYSESTRASLRNIKIY